MSGTSMDGIDLSIIKSDGVNIEKYFFSKTYPYMPKTITELKNYFYQPKILLKNKEYIQNLSDLITNDHIKAIKQAIREAGITPDLIGFHGQTILHEPHKKMSIQLGNGKKISDTFGTNVVYNFRNLDLKNGGQGAPLIPIYHKYLTERKSLPLPTCFLNIGGVANISYINDNKLIGFDTGPGNGLMDIYVQSKTSNNFDFDGNYAKLGYADQEVLNIALQDYFFTLNYPKSLDKMHFEYILKSNKFKKLNIYDALATLSSITIQSIVKGIEMLPRKPSILIVHGGGALNSHLISNLKKKVQCKVVIAQEIGLSTEFLEAELIAYISARKLNNLPTTFPSTTGVCNPTVIGTIVKSKKLL